MTTFKVILRNEWLWWTLAGLAAAAALIEPAYWFLPIVSVACFVKASTVSAGCKSATLGGFLSGFILATGGYSWIWYSFPVGWINEYSLLIQLVFFGSFFLGVVTFAALGTTVTALLFYYLRNKPLILLLTSPALWVLGEVMGSFFLSIWLLGDGGYLNIHAAHSYIGVSFANLDAVLPVATFFGLYGLSGLAALCGVSLALLLMKPEKFWLAPILLILVLSIVNTAHPVHDYIEKDTRVIALDINFNGPLLDNKHLINLKEGLLEQAVLSAVAQSPDYILLPEEYGSIGIGDKSSSLTKLIKDKYPDFSGVIVDVFSVETEQGTLLRGAYHDFGEDSVYFKHKNYLAPQGEYLTYVYEWILLGLRLDDKLARLHSSADFVAGKDFDEDVPSKYPLLLFCSSGSSATGAKWEMDGVDRPFIVHPISHVRFHEPQVLLKQLKAMLRVQSVWTGRPLIVSSSNSESRTYLPDGSFDEGKLLQASPRWRLIEYWI